MTDIHGSQTSKDASVREDLSETITVALIEDNRLVLEGITVLLGRVPDMEVVMGMAGSTGPEHLDQLTADVVLLDLGLENGDSLKLARQVARDIPGSRVVVMDLLPDHEDVVDYVQAGVFGFVMKNATVDELVNTIRSVAGGARVLPAEMTDTLFSQIARDAVASRGMQASHDVCMTPREREVIDLIAEGFSNKKIAARLHISPHTVKSHVRNIMDKLALHTRLQIAAWAHDDDA